MAIRLRKMKSFLKWHRQIRHQTIGIHLQILDRKMEVMRQILIDGSVILIGVHSLKIPSGND